MSELIRREDAINAVEMFFKDAYIEDADVHCTDMEYEINHIPTASPWHMVGDGLPNDGEWAIFTNGKVVTVERFKEDAYNHFFPASEWFDFEDAIAWMPLPEPPKEDA